MLSGGWGRGCSAVCTDSFMVTSPYSPPFAVPPSMPHPFDNPLRTEMAVNKTPCLPPGTVNSAPPAARAAHWRRVSALADDLTTLAGQLNAGLARYLLVLGEPKRKRGKERTPTSMARPLETLPRKHP